MSMFKKVALTIAAILLIGVVLLAMTGRIVPFLTEIWNFVFTEILKMPKAPPSPFSMYITNLFV